MHLLHLYSNTPGLVKDLEAVLWTLLRGDEHGLRHAGEAHTDEALDALWAVIQAEYATFYEQRIHYEAATTEPSTTTSGYVPRIWVGSLSDYNNGQLYGAWMDATLEPEELQAAVQFMLRTSDTPRR